MVNPMMGMTPQQAAQAKEVGKSLRFKFIKRRQKGEFTIQVIATASGVNVPQVVDNLVVQIATQMYNFFGIGGEIEEVG